MTKAKLTNAERAFEFGPTLLWRLDNGIAHSEFFDMMHVVGKQLEAKGKNEVDLPVKPVEIPWTDVEEFRRRLRELLSSVPVRVGLVH